MTSFGSEDEFLITLPNLESGADGSRTMDATQKLLDDLRAGLGGSEVELRREESVGPKIGGELRKAAMNSVVAALALIVLYITVRFVFRYGVAAILALVHDVTLTLGVFSLLDMEISLQIIAAFLTIIGYSLNDTIVVFDRIRENMKLRRKESYRDVINRSINECLSRTILTSLTTFFVAATLYLVGGPVIHDFAFALYVRRGGRYLQFDLHRQSRCWSGGTSAGSPTRSAWPWKCRVLPSRLFPARGREVPGLFCRLGTSESYRPDVTRWWIRGAGTHGPRAVHMGRGQKGSWRNKAIACRGGCRGGPPAGDT